MERFDAITGTDQHEDSFGGGEYDTVNSFCLDDQTRDEIRANQTAARRMLIKLNRAEVFAERCEELSAGPVEDGFEQLQVDVLSWGRFCQLRDRYERHSGGVTVEQRRQVRALLEQAARTGDIDVDELLSSFRLRYRKCSLPSGSSGS